MSCVESVWAVRGRGLLKVPLSLVLVRRVQQFKMATPSGSAMNVTRSNTRGSLNPTIIFIRVCVDGWGLQLFINDLFLVGPQNPWTCRDMGAASALLEAIGK